MGTKAKGFTVRTQNEFVKVMKQNDKSKLNAGQKREQLTAFAHAIPHVSTKALAEVQTLVASELAKR